MILPIFPPQISSTRYFQNLVWICFPPSFCIDKTPLFVGEIMLPAISRNLFPIRMVIRPPRQPKFFAIAKLIRPVPRVCFRPLIERMVWGRIHGEGEISAKTLSASPGGLPRGIEGQVCESPVASCRTTSSSNSAISPSFRQLTIFPRGKMWQCHAARRSGEPAVSRFFRLTPCEVLFSKTYVLPVAPLLSHKKYKTNGG